MEFKFSFLEQKKSHYKVQVRPVPVVELRKASKPPYDLFVSGQFNYAKGTGSVLFLVLVLLSFQGSTLLSVVGSFSQ